MPDIQLLVDMLEPYGGWPVLKGDEWDPTKSWNWLEMSKNMSNDGLPANFIFNVRILVDIENTTINIIDVNNKEECNSFNVQTVHNSILFIRLYVQNWKLVMIV